MAKKKELDIGIFYLCLHKRLHNKVGLSGIITKQDFCRILGESYHIPKVLRVIVIKEMIKIKMVEEIDHKHIKVLPLILDPEINVNRFYEEAGLF